MMPFGLFESTLFSEAPDDPISVDDTGPPDIAESPVSDEIPEDDGPPDIPDMDFGADTEADGIEGEEPAGEPLEVGDKVSVAMNYRLYQRFLTLLNTVDQQMDSMRSNSDMIMTVSPKALDVIEPLGKLGENIRLYMANSFLDTNYSRNFLFYNKCLNLLSMLTEIISSELKATPVDK